MNAIAIIPARGGSRRIPKKNIKDFLGRPILAYPLAAARASRVFSEIWVSTEDADVAGVARRFGAGVHSRSDAMAEDAVGTQEVMRNAILELFPREPRPTFACCIYPCSPTLLSTDFALSYAALADDAERTYIWVEGMMYFGRTEAFLEDAPLDGQGSWQLEDTFRWIDINTIADWHEAEKIYQRMVNEQREARP